MAIKIVNNDSIDRTWVGQTIPVGGNYTLQTSEVQAWAMNDQVLSDIGSGKLIVNDGTSNISGVSNQISYLKGIAPTNSDGKPIVELNLRRGDPGFSNFTVVSHDLSDRTCWYQKSVGVTNETLTTANNLTYSSVHPHWINMNSGKLTYDYKKVLERDGTLSNASARNAIIKVDNVTKTEGTHYTVDYALGTVTFGSPQSGVVTASYYHNDGVAGRSEFLYTPPPGKLYRIDHVESQFSRNASFDDGGVVFEIWAGAVTGAGADTVNLAAYGSFPGFLYDAGYGQSRSIYRNLGDLINWCTNAYPVIPACGHFTQDILCFPFLYIVHPVVSSKQGVTLRLCTQNDVPVTAEICTVTIYMEKGPA